jgi:hypothetical protein
MEKKLKITIGVLIVLLIFSVLTCTNYSSKSSENEELIEALNDTMETWRDKNNSSHSKIQIIETTNPKDFLKLKLQDQEIIELQKEVEKYKSWLSNQGSVTIFKNITKFDTIYQTKLIPSEFNDSTFIAEIHNEWIQTKFGYRNVSTFYNLMVYNKYSVVLGEDKEGFFKKSKSFVEITNHNPYSETTSLRTYQVTQKKKHFSIGPQLGLGITSDVQFNFYVGVGIQYSLIKF